MRTNKLLLLQENEGDADPIETKKFASVFNDLSRNIREKLEILEQKVNEKVDEGLLEEKMNSIIDAITQLESDISAKGDHEGNEERELLLKEHTQMIEE